MRTRGYYEQLHVFKLVNLDEMDKFLKRNLSDLTQEKINNLNRTLCIKALNL